MTAPGWLLLSRRPLDAAHLAQAVGWCDENQAAQLGGEETLPVGEGAQGRHPVSKPGGAAGRLQAIAGACL